MKLMPSLRQKKRYILFEVVSDHKFKVAEIQEAVELAWVDFLGRLGMAKVCPMFIREKSKNNFFIIKVNHQYVDEIKSAGLFIKSIKKQPVIVRSRKVSGTLKQVQGGM